MASLFERAFLQAVKRRRIYHPTRLKTTIRSFHRVCLLYSPQDSNSTSSLSNQASETSEGLDKHAENEGAMASDDMTKQFMRGGFGVIPKCVIN